MSKTKASRGAAMIQDNIDSPLPGSDDTNIDKTEAMFMRITKLITDSFTSCIVKLTAVLEEKMETKISAQATEVYALSVRTDRLERKN